ncbi:MAG: glucose 1-dehydrogenase [Lewinellaceae bacterium]|nr:glucose 1-dehydrogenase [Phaeodactylibacter sp.]MCB0613846.1 glucose 1-dehydrogenase [Phaeodactylibacter sp.]MCB9346310.1 glucose 1-dehydrogenase [Lewinellaceae bacterium]
MKLLEQKVAIVTGGGSGIGRSIARLYTQNGAKACVSDIDEEGGKTTVKQIEEAGGTAFFFKADAGIPEDNKKMVEATIEKYGALHIACNNAGITGPQALIGECPIEEWDHALRVNLSGVFYGMRYQIPEMLKAGGGVIVNMSSVLGKVAFEGSSAYVSSKHGLLGLTKTAALEYSGHGIRTVAVGPGFIQTPMISNNLSEDEIKMVRQLHPIGRLGEAEEVAELVLWLSSDKASFMSGAYIPVDGGYLAR